MSILSEERTSDSPFIDSVTQGCTVSDGSVIRPSAVNWHLVISKYHGEVHPIFVGPWTSAGTVSYAQDAEILWVRFSLGTFMPHLPTKDFRNLQTILPKASGNSFWLKGSAWQFPSYDNVETFIERLVRAGILVHDPIIDQALQGHLPDLASRTVRHRFLRATGLTQLHIYQAERAQRAEELLLQGISILDTIQKLGYYDQPHLTRSLKKFIGHTPAKLSQMNDPG